MRIEGKWETQAITIEVMKIAQVAQLPPKFESGRPMGKRKMKKILEVEALNSEYAAVKFLEWVID